MSTKALKGQLLAAIAMTLVAAVALGSSTFAWFAANTSVTATGAKVTAQADSVLLQIKGANDSEWQTITGTSTSVISLYPVSHDGTTLTTSNVETPGTWWYGYSNSTASSTLNNETKKTLSTETIIGDKHYLGKVTYSLSINDKSGVNQAYDIYVKNITISLSSVSAIVVGENGVQEFKATTANNTSPVALVDTVGKPDAGAKTITVYFYYDGENSAVYTDNLDNLKDATISLSLACYTEDTLNSATPEP